MSMAYLMRIGRSTALSVNFRFESNTTQPTIAASWRKPQILMYGVDRNSFEIKDPATISDETRRDYDETRRDYDETRTPTVAAPQAEAQLQGTHSIKTGVRTPSEHDA